jgi:hypothetical protein
MLRAFGRQVALLWLAVVSLLVGCGLIAYLFPQVWGYFSDTSRSGYLVLSVLLGLCMLSPFAGGAVGGVAVAFMSRRPSRSDSTSTPTVLFGVALGVWIGLPLLAAPVILNSFYVMIGNGMQDVKW